jgi:hypothetical protein
MITPPMSQNSVVISDKAPAPPRLGYHLMFFCDNQLCCIDSLSEDSRSKEFLPVFLQPLKRTAILLPPQRDSYRPSRRD